MQTGEERQDSGLQPETGRQGENPKHALEFRSVVVKNAVSQPVGNRATECINETVTGFLMAQMVKNLPTVQEIWA